ILLELVRDTELRRLRLLRTKDLVAREVHLRFLDGRRHTTVSLLDRVAEEPWALHAYPILTELVLQRDALTDARPCGLVAPGLAGSAPTRSFSLTFPRPPRAARARVVKGNRVRRDGASPGASSV